MPPAEGERLFLIFEALSENAAEMPFLCFLGTLSRVRSELSPPSNIPLLLSLVNCEHGSMTAMPLGDRICRDDDYLVVKS